MKDTIYVIGRRTFEKQKVGLILCIKLTSGEYYDVLFGKDNKGRMYMALAETEYGMGEWHGAYKSGGHWHGSGYSSFIKGYQVKMRKNFTDKDEANKYYNIVKTNMWNKTVQDSTDPKRIFTEEQISMLFA